MNLTIPDKMQDILDKYNFNIEFNKISDNLVKCYLYYTFSTDYIYKQKFTCINTIDDCIKMLDSFYNNTKTKDIASYIWTNHKNECNCKTYDSLINEVDEYFHKLCHCIIELWELCPRIDENLNYLKIYE